MLKNNLNIRFKKFKDSIINNKYKFGKYWEKEKITFEVDFKDGLFNSKGSRDYLPKIFDESIIDDEIVPINGKKFVQLGERKLCTLKNSRSSGLLHLSHYFHEIKKLQIYLLTFLNQFKVQLLYVLPYFQIQKLFFQMK